MDFKAHNTCITEAEKYQGALYVPPKGKGANKKAAPAPAPTPAPEPVVEKQTAKKADKKTKKEESPSLSKLVPKNKQSSLYKIVKLLEKEGSNKSKKDILKDFVVEQKADGSIVLSLRED